MSYFIPLHNSNKIAIVDHAEDFMKACRYKWSVSFRGGRIYRGQHFPEAITAKHKGKSIFLHRIIIGAKRGEVVDHINGDIFDNRKSNLRICTQCQNSRNARKNRSGVTSIYKGVSWKPINNKFRAQIQVDRRNIHLGYFYDQTEAALAYNAAAIKYFGEFARLNIIESR